MKKILWALAGLAALGLASVGLVFYQLSRDLPNYSTLRDYEPQLVSRVFAKDGERIGEFFRERRILIPFDEIPEPLVQAFLAAEDDQFFRHGGINYQAIFRAFIANLRAGRTVQGGSTITQQVAKTLLLSPERTYTRKIREAILARRIEASLSKEEILYLYLNQIYFGQGAYGIKVAADTYFRKDVRDLELHEIAVLAGLPQAPSRYSPLNNPRRAKDRQIYVLNRMAEVGYIDRETANEYIERDLTVFVRQDYENHAPYAVETIRQLLVRKLGETQVLDRGLRIYTGINFEKQKQANQAVREGLRELDKRQGFRGPLGRVDLEDEEALKEFLLTERNRLKRERDPARIIRRDGTIEQPGPLEVRELFEREDGQSTPRPPYLPIGKLTRGVVTEIDDRWGLVHLQVAEGRALIDLATMEWAREPNPQQAAWEGVIRRPSQALSPGDIIELRIARERFSPSVRLNRLLNQTRQRQNDEQNKALEESLPVWAEYMEAHLEQEPEVEAGLLSFDQQTGHVIAMVGGYDFARSEYNRALQAARQTGSAYKTLVYAAALDKGFTPATVITDAPVVFEEVHEDEEGQEETRTWRPTNHSRSFGGDTLFRRALISSLNVPTIKIIEDIGVEWAAKYSRRLGIFSPINKDFTLALGSSSVTLYEMTKAFAQIGRLGRRIHPILIDRVESFHGEILAENITLDARYESEIRALEDDFEEMRLAYLEAQREFERLKREAEEPDLALNGETLLQPNPLLEREPPIYFEDPEQLISPTTAFMTTNILKAAVEERGGTGGRARAVGREVAGKTGTTNGYFDAWFIGYSPQISTGVWVGYDQERTMGRGEVGGRAALPIWVDYMKFAHEDLPEMTFPVPPGIVFANIDNETGRLASAQSRQIVREAFAEGTEPSAAGAQSVQDEETDFFRQDL